MNCQRLLLIFVMSCCLANVEMCRDQMQMSHIQFLSVWDLEWSRQLLSDSSLQISLNDETFLCVLSLYSRKRDCSFVTTVRCQTNGTNSIQTWYCNIVTKLQLYFGDEVIRKIYHLTQCSIPLVFYFNGNNVMKFDTINSFSCLMSHFNVVNSICFSFMFCILHKLRTTKATLRSKRCKVSNMEPNSDFFNTYLTARRISCYRTF